MERSSRAFSVRVVEPNEYLPATHTGIFHAVMTHQLAPGTRPLIDAGTHDRAPTPTAFDLITFPEAFVSPDAFMAVLDAMETQARSTGCVHIGLRPNDDDTTHLFSVSELRGLVDRILALEFIESGDLSGFSRWLDEQKPADRFNLGALFGVDAKLKLRMCLHPKHVRSQSEYSPLPERQMEEADLLAVVTLNPVERKLKSVTIQPIICSDFLKLPRDRNGAPPVHALNDRAGDLLPRPPDHVDVVSVVTCTRQVENLRTKPASRQWHEKFLDGFKDTQEGDLPRHNFATVVLANFRYLKNRAPGGLSGAFLPIAPSSMAIHPEVVVSSYGRGSRGSANAWTKSSKVKKSWQHLGFVAGLDPFADPDDSPVRIFDFTIQRLPRDNAVWDRRPPALTNCSVETARLDVEGKWLFERSRS